MIRDPDRITDCVTQRRDPIEPRELVRRRVQRHAVQRNDLGRAAAPKRLDRPLRVLERLQAEEKSASACARTRLREEPLVGGLPDPTLTEAH